MKQEKKGTKGEATSFITRAAAIKKLQITISDFRKLCILKGVYPRDPKKKLKGANKIYYFTKDITFLSHDPLIQKFREQKTIKQKIKRAVAKNQKDVADKLKKSITPPSLDRLIKERYPTFQDALHDLDDALSMIYLFANFTTTSKFTKEINADCNRLAREFELYVTKSQSLRKVFISIKGFYYQADIAGETVTWLVPHRSILEMPKGVDAEVMLTFLDFYRTLTGFVLFKLYASLGLRYPPVLEASKDQETGLTTFLQHLEHSKLIPMDADSKIETEQKKVTESRIKTLDTSSLKQLDANQPASAKEKEDNASANAAAATADDDEDDIFIRERKAIDASTGSQLFSGCKFFLSREVPRASLEFVIRACGGDVSWEDDPNAPFLENDEEITHQIVDRNSQRHQYLSRSYIQPQWVYDCVNEKVLLPSHEYIVGAILPPHLSPFMDDEASGYVPLRREKLDAIKKAITEGHDPESLILEEEAEEQEEEKESDNEETSAANDAAEEEQEEEEQEEDDNELEAKYKAELRAEKAGKLYNADKKIVVSTNKRKNNKEEEEDEESKFGEMMLTGTKRYLYKGLERQERGKKLRAERLTAKREAYEAKQKEEKKAKAKK